ncbi:MAG TPA: ABC transporter ATP-binding protein [Candidatus Aquicultor sp.]
MNKQSASNDVCASDLVKQYDAFAAVKGITFAVKHGECFGLLGPNGAGKTTTIRMLYGMSPPTAGELYVLDQDIRTHARAIKRCLGVVPQETNLDTDLTVLENLEVYANYFGIPKNIARERASELLNFIQLEGRTKTMVDELSGGMKRRLLLARALINNPKLIILDEPTTGLDPQARHLIWDKMRELKGQQVTLVLTTHYMEEASQLCDRIVIMDEGTIIAEGSPAELINRYISREALEIRVAPGQSQRAIDVLSPLSETYEVQDDTLVFFASSVDVLMRAAEEAHLPIEYVLVRLTTLEDVFLKLTGRRLRD